MWFRRREYKIYMKRSWYLKEVSMGSTWKGQELLIDLYEKAYNLNREIMKSRGREHNTYMTSS